MIKGGLQSTYDPPCCEGVAARMLVMAAPPKLWRQLTHRDKPLASFRIALPLVAPNLSADAIIPAARFAHRSFHYPKLPEGQAHIIMDGRLWLDKLKSNPPPALPSDTGATPDTMAYVVMSSGTTGTPKGICCPHRGAVHSYHWRHTNNPINPGVDVSGCNVFFVWECIRPLLAGGTTLIIPDHCVYDPKALTNIIEKYSVSRMQFTPSLLAHTMASLSDDVLQAKMKSFKYVNLCGEVVTRNMVSKFNRLFPDCELVNLYSISECHDVAQANLSGPNNELQGPSR